MSVTQPTSPQTGVQNAIIVLGMHRSGTSALAGIIQILGADIGSSLVPAEEDVNPKGFWEHAEIVDIHDQLLEVLGSSWQDARPLPHEWWTLPVVLPFKEAILTALRRDFSRAPLWLLKDPRLCHLLPLWLEIFAEVGCRPHFIISVRHPLEVAESLNKRDHITYERASLLWIEHYSDAEKWTRGYPRSVVFYERLLLDWRGTVNQLSTELSLPLQPSDGAMEKAVERFLEPSLRHHIRRVEEEETDHIMVITSDFYWKLLSKSPRYNLETLTISSHDEIIAVVRQVSPWEDEIQYLWHSCRQLESDLKQNRLMEVDLRREISRVKSTLSWRITAPLRVTWNLICKLTGRV